MIIETSKDILFVVLAFCILWVTIFICWILYYFLMTAKRVNDTAKSAKEKLDKIGEIIDLAKTKINEGASYVGAVVEGVVRLSEHFREKKTRGGKRNRARCEFKKFKKF